MSDYYIPIIFHNERIGLPVTGGRAPLGHAGAMIVDGTTGNTRYFEYGRYNNTSGIVQTQAVIQATITNNDALTSSVVNSIRNLSNDKGNHGDIWFNIVEVPDGSFQKMNNFGQSGLDVPDKYGIWLPWNSCLSFTQRMGALGGYELIPEEIFEGVAEGAVGSALFSLIPAYATNSIYRYKGGVYMSREGNIVSQKTVSDQTNRSAVSLKIIDSLKDFSKECFVAGTEILTDNFQTKMIEDISIGDTVLAFDAYSAAKSGKLYRKKVVNIHRNTTRVLIDLRGLVCTPNHVFYTQDTHVNSDWYFDTIINILRRDGLIMNQDGSSIRARTGSIAGSKEDTITNILYYDMSGTEHCVRVRAGIPVIYSGTSNENDIHNNNYISICDWIERSGANIDENGKFIISDKSEFECVSWPQDAFLFDKSESQTWIVTDINGLDYLPDWIANVDTA